MNDRATTDTIDINPITHTQTLTPYQVQPLKYIDNVLHIDGVSTQTLQQHYGTPCYVYSKNAILAAYHSYALGFEEIPHQICYAVKANSNLAILKLLADAGAGFDIVSIGELKRVLQVTDGTKVIFSGVGKSSDDIKAALLADIHSFNVEAISELDLINQIAGTLGKRANISIRVNPDVDAQTHPYIATGLKDNKFGIAYHHAKDAYLHAKSLPFLNIIGIDCHIGSQIISSAPFVDALHKIASLIDKLASDGITLQHIDIGGGLGVRYINETPESVAIYAQALLPILKRLNLKVYLEPGRNMVANAGVLLTKAITLKPTDDKNFMIVDASMSELIRPALYGSQMAIIPAMLSPNAKPSAPWDVVGAVCESGDFLAKNRMLSPKVGELFAMTGAGAYSFVMASNYNSRPRPPEILCDAGTHRIIRHQERYEDLWRDEVI